MKRRSLSGLVTQLHRATEAAVEDNRRLVDLVHEVGQELRFRGTVATQLEQYRQDLIDGQPRHPLKAMLDRVESYFIELAMKETGDNIARAAELLDLPEATLRYKLGKHGLR